MDDQSVCVCVCLFVRLTCLCFVIWMHSCLFVCLFVCLYVCSFVCLCVWLFTCLFVGFVCLFVCLFVLCACLFCVCSVHVHHCLIVCLLVCLCVCCVLCCVIKLNVAATRIVEGARSLPLECYCANVGGKLAINSNCTNDGSLGQTLPNWMLLSKS